MIFPLAVSFLASTFCRPGVIESVEREARGNEDGRDDADVRAGATSRPRGSLRLALDINSTEP